MKQRQYKTEKIEKPYFSFTSESRFYIKRRKQKREITKCWIEEKGEENGRAHLTVRFDNRGMDFGLLRERISRWVLCKEQVIWGENPRGFNATLIYLFNSINEIFVEL